jgi:DNA-binding NtrC family response regulator
MNEEIRILIVDDDWRMAKTLVDILKIKGYTAEAAHSAEEALEQIEKNRFHCVLTDVKMPGMNGVELHRAIQKISPELPVILMTAYAADDLITEGLEEGVIAALTKPLDINLLLSFFSSLQKEQTIVIVDDDPKFCEILKDILGARGYKVISLMNPCQLEKVGDFNAQIIIFDLRLNHMTGLDVLKHLREHHPDLPVIMVTAYKEDMMAAIQTAEKYNIRAWLYKPFNIEALILILDDLRQQELKNMIAHKAE